MRLPRLLVLLLLGAAIEASELVDRLDEAMATVPAGAGVGVALLDTMDHGWLYRRGADAPRSLASTTKLLVASAALLQLGTEYQFHTRLIGLGPLVQGELPGLGVIGGGSPCLDEHFAEGGDPDSFFRGFAAELRRQGVVRIAGDLVIDNRLFDGVIRPDTYPQDADNQQRWFSAPASAFAWNDNCIEVRLLPTAAGQAARVGLRPHSPRIQVTNQSRTTAGASRPIFTRELGSNAIIASGTCSVPTSWFPLAMQSDPDLLNGDQLKAVLIESGIPVTGSVRLGVVDPLGGPLLVDLRQPLVPAVTLMNQHSQNFYGEQLLRLVAVARGRPGSIAAGCPAVLETLVEHLGAGFGDVQLLDGCGLSYGNQASATTMVHLLDTMNAGPAREAFIDSLKERPSGGVRGRVKTGTLAVACCLVGYLDPPKGHRHAFAILLNRGDATGFAWAPKLRDRLYETMAAGIR